MYLDYSKMEFDREGKPEVPELLLKTLGGKTVGIIPGVYNLKFNIKFSEPSEISFDIPANGSNGSNGSDASVTRANIVRAMLNNIEDDGLYTTEINGKQCLGINATAIKSGAITGIDIYGSAYHDLDNTATLKLVRPSATNPAALVYYAGSKEAFKVSDTTLGVISFSSYEILPFMKSKLSASQYGSYLLWWDEKFGFHFVNNV